MHKPSTWTPLGISSLDPLGHLLPHILNTLLTVQPRFAETRFAEKSYYVSSITFLVGTFCNCNSEQSQHSYAELGYLFYDICALNALKTRLKRAKIFARFSREVGMP